MAAKPNSKLDVRVSETPSGSTTNEKRTAPRDEERQNASSSAAFTNDWWIWELIGIVGSAAALIGLIVLLRAVNDKPQPIWGGKFYCIKNGTICKETPQVSLNSVISLISTVAKICVLIPVTKGLGQLKWVYFAEKDRTLADFETFESATRGLTGSAMLVWRLRLRHFAVLGAVAMILSLAFDPFVQNLVHYTPQNHEDQNQIAYLANATHYDFTDLGNKNGSAVDTKMSASIAAAVYNQDSAQAWGTPFYVCTANCTWEDVTTVSAQAWCSNVTDQLQLTCDNNTVNPSCVASLPNGFSLRDNEVMRVNSSAPALIYKNYTNPLAILQSIYAPGTMRLNQSTPFFASECVLVPSVRTITANMSVLEDPVTIVNSAFNKINFTETERSYTEAYTPSPDGGITFPSHPSFGFSAAAYRALQSHLAATFSGNVTADPATASYRYNNNAALQAMYRDAEASLKRRIQDAAAELPPEPIVCTHDRALPYDSVGCAVSRAALAVTKTMRDTAWDHYDDLGGTSAMIFHRLNDAGLTKGKAYSAFTYVKVAWYWISLPVALWLLSVVILMGTAWKSRRAGIAVWRTSPLAMVFMGLEGRLTEEFRGNGLTERGLSDKAGTLQVRLKVDDRRPAFVDAV